VANLPASPAVPPGEEHGPLVLRALRDTEEDAAAVRDLLAVASDPGGGRGWRPDQLDRAGVEARHLAATDPEGGSWIALDGAGRALGVAQSLRREGTWALATLAVHPRARGRGVGTALLRRALVYGRACLRGLICSPPHPAAVRAYRRAGFDVHPVMTLRGTPDGSGLTAPDGAVIDGSAAHRDLMDSVDRRLRGGAHGPDHALLLRQNRLLVSDDLAGSGYCYLTPDGRVELLGATSRRMATRLLTAALLTLPGGTRAEVPHVSADQQWALDVGLAAGLEAGSGGFLCLRGLRPPSPYLPSGTFL
jgi:GNAT superfamily N-acetyltransferase